MAPKYVVRSLDKADRGTKGPVYKLLHLVDDEGKSLRVVGGMVMFKKRVFVFADDGNPLDMLCNGVDEIEQKAKFCYWGINLERTLSRVKPHLARKAA